MYFNLHFTQNIVLCYIIDLLKTIISYHSIINIDFLRSPRFWLTIIKKHPKTYNMYV